MNRRFARIFYAVKPLFPRPAQIGLRRQIAAYKRKRYSHLWPIDPSAGEKPPVWPGWPGGKKFALVLTHDVEGAKGQAAALRLCELEMGLGFRSAFSFIPERYPNDDSVKRELKKRGFEICLHGLRHDGKEFVTREVFEQRAIRMRKYLRNWDTRGFTAPSMICRHEWLHELDITHSISSFDTDPFEPNAEPARRIFPYWVANGRPCKGFVELPYTLPQDHLLFVILKEKDIDIWKRKLAWVAACGGMALLNTHPDYMNFGDASLSKEEYPVDFYAGFLRHVRDEYDGQYYAATPAAVADYFRQTVSDCDVVRGGALAPPMAVPAQGMRADLHAQRGCRRRPQ